MRSGAYFGHHHQTTNMGNERSGPSRKNSNKSSNSSSSSVPEKPKQPQRGLGVAQLEKIRLHGQMAACTAYLPSLHASHPFGNPLQQEENRILAAAAAAAGYGAVQGPPMHPPAFTYSPPQATPSYGYHPNMMMGMGDGERTNYRYGADHSQNPRWNPNNIAADHNQQTFIHPGTGTRYLLNSSEGPMQRTRNDNMHEAGGSSSHNSAGSSVDNQDLDLELRL